MKCCFLLATIVLGAALGALSSNAREAGIPAADQPPAAGARMGGGVVDLGGGKYRIGAIEVDKNAGRFEVPGAVLPLDTEAMPIEFLAVTRGGMKAYEAVIELESSAVEFNTACILIGLDAAQASHPEYHFDPTPLEGDRVSLEVSWDADGKVVERPLLELVLADGKPAVGEWVYTGSAFTRDGTYLAEEFGTLIGVVHDPDSIIQHRTGLGLGDYGAVLVNTALMPPVGTRMTIRVSARQ